MRCCFLSDRRTRRHRKQSLSPIKPTSAKSEEVELLPSALSVEGVDELFAELRSDLV